MRLSRLSMGAVVACIATTGAVQAGLIHHSTLDDAANTTANGTFSVAAEVGTAGTAGGAANSVPAATTTDHLTSGSAGQIGDAFSFPGTENAGVRFGSIAPPGTGDYSVSLWYNFQGAAQNGMLASSGNTGSSGEGWSIFHENGALIFRMSIGGGGNDLRAAVHGDVANDSDWHHAALVINAAGTVQGYIDGAEVTDIGTGGPPDGTFVPGGDGIANADPVLLGVRANGGFQFAGDLDDFRVYDMALSATEVRALAGVPEPATVILAGLAVVVVGAAARRRR